MTISFYQGVSRPMSFKLYTDMLQGLVDGSHPLPAPHPQRLSFRNDPDDISEVASAVRKLVSFGRLSELQARHLSFKLASWCSRRGLRGPDQIRAELREIRLELEMAVRSNPKWITSRAGVAWTIRSFAQLQLEALRESQKNSVVPPRVAELEFRGFYLVELLNGAHVFAEGVAMGHCMASAYNAAALKTRGARVTGQDVLDCLTYAVKLRHRELRLFSVRNRKGEPVLTISYHPKHAWVMRMQERRGSYGRAWQWSRFKCDAARALSTVVRIKRVFPEVVCRSYCPGNGWCKTAIVSGVPRMKTLMHAFRFDLPP